MLPDKLSFVDIETTGIGSSYDRIIEIGILRVEDNKLVKTFESLINPETYVSPFIESLTGIKASDLEDAPTFEEIKDQILEVMEDSIFVAHNARFDLSFLKNEFRRHSDSFSPKHFCTVKLSRLLFPKHKNHNLDSIIERFGISCARRHRAFDDAKVLWDFYKIVQQKVVYEKLQNAFSIVLKRPSLPINLKAETVDLLPESTGVYIFYAQDQTPLYVGKSINIKDRVLSHFSSDHTSGREMAISQQVAHIETIITTGELGALFKESMLIKKLQPTYNRKLRLQRRLNVIKKIKNDDGYYTIKLEILTELRIDQVDDIIAVCKSKKQAKEFLLQVAKKHKLCNKLLGLDKGRTYCFSYHLDVCKGACMDEEVAEKYNLRFILAFTQHAFKPWPFAGPIIITEKSEDGSAESFVVDKWCLIARVQDELNSQNIEQSEPEIFDVDTYKILNRYIQNKKNVRRIRTMPPRIVINELSKAPYFRGI